jgi:uncharacterized protein YjbJ (UPF0337 family)
MAKSAQRDTANGVIDRIAGRALEAWGALTGRKSTKAKGKAARARGWTRTTKGRAKAKRRRGR